MSNMSHVPVERSTGGDDPTRRVDLEEVLGPAVLDRVDGVEDARILVAVERGQLDDARPDGHGLGDLGLVHALRELGSVVVRVRHEDQELSQREQKGSLVEFTIRKIITIRIMILGIRLT